MLVKKGKTGMKKGALGSGVALFALMAISTGAFAQSAPVESPAARIDGMASGEGGAFSGYVPAVPNGMGMGGSGSANETVADPVTPTTILPQDGTRALPSMSDGQQVSAEKIDGFNTAIEEAFPMTPDMVRRYREIFDENQRALLERTQPDARVDAGFISLEPGETPPALTVAPGIASVIGFYDVTGQPWPISQYVIGSGDNFQVVQLGEGANNIAVSPLTRVGWTNLVVVLKDQPKPVVMKVEISEKSAHFRHDVQIMASGPNATVNTAAAGDVVREAGSGVLLSALSGVDLPQGSKPLKVAGVDARAWKIGDTVFLRSRHALLSPSWLSSMSGPDGIRVYEIKPSSFALFSVDGTIVRADVTLP